MAKRIRKAAWRRSFQRVVKTMMRTAMRVETRAIKEGLRAVPLAGQRVTGKKAMAPSAHWMTGLAIGTGDLAAHDGC